MNFQELGNTGQRVSRICLGTWQLGGGWGTDNDLAIDAVGVAFDLGINFFDTAAAYGKGAAETGLAKGLGALIAGHRDELVLSTKGGLEVHSIENGLEHSSVNSDPKFLRACLEQSLTNLGVDYVDVYFIHWPDPTIPFAETAGVVGQFIDEGLVRFSGLSNFSVSQMNEFASERNVDVVQLPYNLLARDSKDEVISHCTAQGIGVMGWSALAHGILSGTLRRTQTFSRGDWRAEHPAFSGEGFKAVIDGVEQLTEIADDLNCSLPQLAIAWILADPDGIVPIVGAQVPQHILDSAAATEIELSASTVDLISQTAARIPAFELEPSD